MQSILLAFVHIHSRLFVNVYLSDYCEFLFSLDNCLAVVVIGAKTIIGAHNIIA